MTSRFLPDDLMSGMSLMPKPSPMPKIGPMSGEMSMAPMITGMEFTLSPTEAMTTAMAKIHALGPRK